MECLICQATSENSHLIENTVLFESENFVMLPTVGPLVKGHVMLVSKKHNDSMGEMGLKIVKEFKSIIGELSRKHSFFDSTLITEHGSYGTQKGGACVSHTHIHFIPEFFESYNILDDFLPIMNLSSIDDLVNVNAPYILNTNSNGDLRIYEAYNSYSQIVRKAICNKYNRLDSDWKADHKMKLIEETINLWK